MASGAPLISGLIAGIVGGIVVGMLSGSQISVSGPVTGLTAVVVSQPATLGFYEAFLCGVVLAGLVQTVLGTLRAGEYFAFVPSSVIHGLIAAIGVILVLKQLPHVLGHDIEPSGEMSFIQPDQRNTFSEVALMLSGDIHRGATLVGMASLVLLLTAVSLLPTYLNKIPLAAVLVVPGFRLASPALFARMWLAMNWAKTHLAALNLDQLFPGSSWCW